MKILYIANMARKLNEFSHSSMLAALKLKIDFHIAANWGYKSEKEKMQDEKKYGITIHQIDFIRKPYDIRNIRAYKQICQLIRCEQFDLIHCNTPIGGVVGRLAGKKCGVKKVIYQAHGFHFYKGASWINWIIYYPIEKWLAHYTDILITINQEDFLLATKKMHLKKEGRIYYVPGVGIDLNKFKIREGNKEEYIKNLGIEDGHILYKKILISVGELNANKNNKIVIKALGLLKDNTIHYIICGTGTEKNRLQELARTLEIESQIHFLGFRTDIAELLAASDIFVLPSFREGLSRSLMEAMACGLPCVVSDIRGNRDLVDNGKTGFCCIPTNEQEFAYSIQKLVSDNQLRQRFSQCSKEKIQGYNIDLVVQKMIEIYKEALLEKIV